MYHIFPLWVVYFTFISFRFLNTTSLITYELNSLFLGSFHSRCPFYALLYLTPSLSLAISQSVSSHSIWFFFLLWQILEDCVTYVKGFRNWQKCPNIILTKSFFSWISNVCLTWSSVRLSLPSPSLHLCRFICAYFLFSLLLYLR